MEEESWKKDETPYLIFPCSKCGNFMYVKTIKKNKKCLRCRRSHTVEKVRDSGEVVEGMTEAVDRVKLRQHELALIQLKREPNFQTTGGFQIHQSSSKIVDITPEDDILSKKFKDLLTELSLIHDEFPLYVIEIGADKYNIPSSELRHLTHSFLKKGILISKDNNIFKVKLQLDFC